MLNKTISTDEKLSSLSIESQLIYTWIQPHLDVEGRIIAVPEAIKGTVFPFNDNISVKKIKKSLQELHEAKLFVLYGDKNQYLCDPQFMQNQDINPTREAKSTIPTPEELQSNTGETPQQVKLSKVEVKTSLNKDNKHGNPKSGCDNPPKIDFRDSILDIFCEEFEMSRGFAYEFLTVKSREAEKQGCQHILNHYKKKQTEAGKKPNSEETLDDLRQFFRGCLRLTDTFISQNIKPTLIASQFMQIYTKINFGENNGKSEPKTTRQDIADISDYLMRKQAENGR